MKKESIINIEKIKDIMANKQGFFKKFISVVTFGAFLSSAGMAKATVIDNSSPSEVYSDSISLDAVNRNIKKTVDSLKGFLANYLDSTVKNDKRIMSFISNLLKKLDDANKKVKYTSDPLDARDAQISSEQVKKLLKDYKEAVKKGESEKKLKEIYASVVTNSEILLISLSK